MSNVLWAAALLLQLATFRAAQAQAVDIELSGRVLPSAVLAPGVEAIIELRFTNLGPASPVAVGAVSGFYPDDLITIFAVSDSGPCTLSFDSAIGPFGQSFFAALVMAGPVSTGSSVTCRLGIRSGHRVTRTFNLRFLAQVASPGIVDGNPANNEISLPLQLGPALAVPAVGRIGTILLAVLLIVFAFWSLRRWN